MRILSARHGLASIGILIAAGCNALTAADDLRVAEAPATAFTETEAGVVSPEVAPAENDAGDASARELVCPRGLSDCNLDPTDACEINTTNDTKNCGKCGFSCAVGAYCVEGQCSPSPGSCKDLLAAVPDAPNGTYEIDPDGTGPAAPISAPCDMTTANGGWTVIFAPDNFAYGTHAVRYTIDNRNLMNAATHALLAYRDDTGAVKGTTATFALPADWRTRPPFQARAEDLVVAVSLNGAAAISRTLRYGYAYFHSVCTDEWDTTRLWGRICIEGTTAPFFASYATAGTDTCPDSSQGWNAATCSTQRRFTIAVR